MEMLMRPVNIAMINVFSVGIIAIGWLIYWKKATAE
jgi:hypothetical protein